MFCIPWVLFCYPSSHAQGVDSNDTGKQRIESEHYVSLLVQKQKCIHCKGCDAVHQKNSQRNLRGKREIQQVILKSIKIAYICLLMQPAHSQGRRHISRKKRLNMMVVPRAVLRVQGRNCQ